jgi:hypothetical protein
VRLRHDTAARRVDSAVYLTPWIVDKIAIYRYAVASGTPIYAVCEVFFESLSINVLVQLLAMMFGDF